MEGRLKKIVEELDWRIEGDRRIEDRGPQIVNLTRIERELKENDELRLNENWFVDDVKENENWFIDDVKENVISKFCIFG